MIGDDPLERIVRPHAEIMEGLRRGSLAMRFYFSRPENRISGKWAIFHGKTRLRKLYPSKTEAHLARIKILGLKEKCWANAKIYQIRKLP